MKSMLRMISILLFTALLLPICAASAQENIGDPFTGLTIKLGEWTLQFTEVTEDQEAIRKAQSGSWIVSASPGNKIIRLAMDVPPECKRVNCDDLEVTLLDKTGDAHGYSMRSHWSDSPENGSAVYKIQYLIIVPEIMTFADLTLRVVVTGEEAYTCPLNEVTTGDSIHTDAPI